MSSNHRRSATLILCLLALTPLLSRPFQPENHFSLGESWRWHELEALNGYTLYHGVEDNQGHLYFSSNKGLLAYDGYSIEVIPFPIEDPEFGGYELFYSKTGYIYLNSSAGIFTYAKGKWTEKLPHNTPQAERRHLFATSAYGTEVMVHPLGLYLIDGPNLSRVDSVPHSFSSAAFDKENRLWCTFANSTRFISLQFEKEAIKEPLESQIYDLGLRDSSYPWVIASPSSSEIWASSWRLDVMARRLNPNTSRWDAVDLKHLSGDNGHTSGYRISDTDMVLFSKTALLIKRDEEWHSINFPEFNFPTNHPFHILRANGNLILGGRGEKIYEIAYQSEQRESLQGLHFQCDVAGKNRWYLSIDGHVVEQDTIYDTWTQHEENVIDTPVVIIKSDDDIIWVAGAHKGVPAVSYYNGRSWQLNTHPELNGYISHLSATQLEDGTILFGSGGDEAYDRPGGLISYRKASEGYELQWLAPPLATRRPIGFAEGKKGELWNGGLRIIRFQLDGDSDIAAIDEAYFSELWIDHIITDHQGDLWAGLWDRGLFKREGNNWIQINHPDQIASSQVAFLLKDQVRDDNIWIATDRGVSRFDGKIWYPHALPQSLRFNREAGTLKQSTDGAIWINHATRSWFFRKDTNFYITKALHDNFKTVRYQPDNLPPIVSISTEIPQTTSPANVFIEWRGADKWTETPTARLKYSYRLNDQRWSPFSEGNKQTLLDMPSGDHRFEVKALDLDGNISARSALASFTVIPPIWQRPWFIALSILLFGTIILLIYLLFRQRIQHIMQIEEFKLQFFTNISHELRTPLTVILGPIESQLAKLPPDWNKKPLQIAHKNAKKTLALIDQILDFRSAESGRIKLNLARSDLNETVRETVHLIKPLADDQSQVLHLHCPSPPCVVWFDAEKIERILNNLISNAVKYTQKHGKIDVRIQFSDFEETVTATFVVEDNGSGIPSGKIDDIFEVFYRAGNALHAKVRGSGIGLAYTKNLVAACDGSITVESPITNINGKKQGTRFTVSLPFQKSIAGYSNEPFETDIDPQLEAEDAAETSKPDDAQSLILVAEDDRDILEFIATELHENYQVKTAVNGRAALSIALQDIPDLVITDIMMPEIDGKELCRQIKADERTAHIPVIMLTALKSEAHELEGLEVGADDYISKPVRLSILKRRIHNLLESRKKYHQRFSQLNQETALDSEAITSNPIDKAFINKSVSIVEERLIDPLFDVETFAKQMNMSRMTLYRKFKAVTGDSPSAFIRSIRLNKAAGLLATGDHTVSEISDMVGITDLSSFSTSFKKHFNVSPRQFAQRRRTE